MINKEYIYLSIYQFYKTTIEILDRFHPKEIKMTARDPDYMTPSIKSKLRKKNKLMHKGRLEEANQLAKRIGMEITKANAIRLRTLDSRRGSKEFWAAVSKE